MSPPNDGGPAAVSAEANHRTEPNHNHEVHDQCSGSCRQDAAAYVVGLHRRREASRRLPVLECCRHADPWRYDEPGERGYSDAAYHLLTCGLTPAPHRRGLRRMRRSGDVSRRAAQVIAERWELAG